MSPWLVHHADALGSAARRLLGAPLNTALSLFVIGIALALPAAGYLLVANLGALAQGAGGKPQISLFLEAEAGKAHAAEIERRLTGAAPGPWRFVPRDEALRRLQENDSLAGIVQGLPRNPLPDAFIVEPADTTPAALEALAAEFAAWPRVAHVQLDSAWVRRLDALVRVGRLAVTLLAAVFAAALVAVTFNTIRLQVLAQGAEIELARLIGATDGWIRRPFQYYGALQGALGGLFAAALVGTGAHLLAEPVAELAVLYGGSFTLRSLAPGETGLIALAGGLLGWLGAQLSVGLYLRRIGGG